MASRGPRTPNECSTAAIILHHFQWTGEWIVWARTPLPSGCYCSRPRSSVYICSVSLLLVSTRLHTDTNDTALSTSALGQYKTRSGYKRKFLDWSGILFPKELTTGIALGSGHTKQAAEPHDRLQSQVGRTEDGKTQPPGPSGLRLISSWSSREVEQEP